MARRPKSCLLDQNLPLRELVLEKLEMKWSPEQISGWLRRTKPHQKTLRILPETSYKTLCFRCREALHHLNVPDMRRSHSLRHGRRHTRKGERVTINIVNGTPIHKRSRHIDNRRSQGHWEGDLVSGTKKRTYRHTCRSKITQYDHPETQRKRCLLGESGSYRKIPELTA